MKPHAELFGHNINKIRSKNQRKKLKSLVVSKKKKKYIVNKYVKEKLEAVCLWRRIARMS